MTAVDEYGLSREQLIGCLCAYFRNRHKRRQKYQTGRRVHETISQHRAYRRMVQHYIERIRYLDAESG